MIIDDAKRLLTVENFEALQQFYGDHLAEILSKAPEPPEMGIAATDDEYMSATLEHLMNGLTTRKVLGQSLSGSPALLKNKIVGIGMAKNEPGETRRELEDRIAKSLGARVIRFD